MINILKRIIVVMIFVILVPFMLILLFASIVSPFTSWLITGESEETDYLGKIYNWFEKIENLV